MISKIKGPTTKVLKKLYADPDLAINVTYRVYKSQSYNPSKGSNATSYSEYPNIKAILLSNSASISAAGSIPSMSTVASGAQVGNSVILIRTPDLPTGVSLRDTIVESDTGKVYNVVRINPIFGIVTQFEVRHAG